MSVVGYLDRLRHRTAGVTSDSRGNQLITTGCGLTLVRVVRGWSCTGRTKGHMIALPTCRWHMPVARCPEDGCWA